MTKSRVDDALSSLAPLLRVLCVPKTCSVLIR